MRFIILFSLSILLFNCENTQSKKKTVTKPEPPVEKKEIIKQDTVVEPKREFPELTEENAMDFFLEYGKQNKENKIRITTDFGEIDVLLYNETNFHRANFIFLTKQKYFDGTQFYRVVDNFIIQGGNTDDPEIKRKRRPIGRYLLPKDIRHGFKHHRGVISIPSSDAVTNPHKLASPYEFFIVQKRDGAYHLDDNYTVFGRVIRGMDVVDEIASQETDNGEWPLNNIYIKKVEIIN